MKTELKGKLETKTNGGRKHSRKKTSEMCKNLRKKKHKTWENKFSSRIDKGLAQNLARKVNSNKQLCNAVEE